ncbi:MAG: hypothetical protein MJZ13_08750 [Bacteroidales bacterium]|nr:hypothetical protein [Bacteroidales bacterium]
MLPILLTATVNPNGMKGAMFDPAERAEMYRSALAFYAQELAKQKDGGRIVFAENSNTRLELPSLPENVKIEYLNVNLDGFDSSKGKGYNEVLLILKAVRSSRFIKEAGCFFKITGRLKLLNVRSMLAECEKKMNKAPLHFLADCKDHSLYEKLHIKVWGHVGECRYWYSDVDFFEWNIGSRYQWLNDYVSPTRLAEDLMLDVCRKTRGKEGCYDRFRTQAILSGTGGHDIEKGSKFFHSTDYDSWQLKVKCGMRQIIRWCLPGWRI